MKNEDPIERPIPATGAGRRFTSLEAASVAGIIAGIGWVYVFSRLTRGPGFHAPRSEVEAYFADPNVGWDVLAVLQILVIATAAFLWFVGVVRAQTGRNTPMLFDTVFFGGGILLAGLLFSGAAALAAPYLLTDGGIEIDTGAATMFRGYATVVLGTFAPRIAALIVFSASTLGLRTGAQPRWLVVIGYLTGIALLVNVAFWSASIYLFPAWVVFMSLVLLIRRRSG